MIKLIVIKDIPSRADYLCCKCGFNKNRMDLYYYKKELFVQCIECNETFSLVSNYKSLNSRTTTKTYKKIGVKKNEQRKIFTKHKSDRNRKNESSKRKFHKSKHK